MFLELQWEDLGSSLVATRTSGNFLCCLRELKLLLSCDGSTGLLEPLQWNQASSCIEGQNLLGFLESWQKTLGCSQVATGTSNPLVLPQESQLTIQVSRGLSGFLCSRCRGIWPHLELRLEPQGSSPVLTWISGFQWSFNRGSGLISCGDLELCFPLEI